MSVPGSPESEAAGGDPIKRTYPLNSRRLTAEILGQIAGVLEPPTTALLAHTRQMTDEKLVEKHDPRNVQVDVTELASGSVAIELQDESGLIMELAAESEDNGEAGVGAGKIGVAGVGPGHVMRG